MLFANKQSRDIHLCEQKLANDPKVGSFPTSLVEFIKVDVELEEEFEGSFHRNEIVAMKLCLIILFFHFNMYFSLILKF
jgi:hypothetical protein